MRSPTIPRREDGVALIVCLLMMVVIFLLGTSAAQIAIQEEKASRHERDRLLAFQSAEAALKDAELDIERSTRAEEFKRTETGREAGYCAAGLANSLLGLCLPAAPDMIPVWQKINVGPETISVPFGLFTGRILAAGGSVAPPRYIIEVLSDPATEELAAGEANGGTYRITSIGYGNNERTQVVLQVLFRKNPEGHFTRLAWREILNWEELREALESS